MLWDLLIAESTKAIMVSNEATYMKEIDGVSIDKHQTPKGRHFIARGAAQRNPGNQVHTTIKPRRGDIRTKG